MQILPLIQKYKVVHLNRTDARLANNGQPLDIQKLRCRVNFGALRFTPQIEELGQKVIKLLRKNGPFLVLHLRYEMDMLAFSGCTQGCNSDEVEELTRMRSVDLHYEPVIEPVDNPLLIVELSQHPARLLSILDQHSIHELLHLGALIRTQVLAVHQKVLPLVTRQQLRAYRDLCFEADLVSGGYQGKGTPHADVLQPQTDFWVESWQQEVVETDVVV